MLNEENDPLLPNESEIDDEVLTKTVDPEKKYFDELVGEGKKFSDPEKLARSKVESDLFIDRLKRELKGLREELNTRQKVTDLLDRLNTTSNKPSNSPPSRERERTEDEDYRARQEDDPNDRQRVSQAEIEKLLDQTLTQRDTQRQLQANLDLVRSELAKAYGDHAYTKVLKERSEELGLNKDQRIDLASKNPKAFLRMIMGGDAVRQNNSDASFAPPRSVINAPMPNHSSENGERRKSFYDNLKKQNPTTYWSDRVQNQMHKDAIKLGSTFFDT